MCHASRKVLQTGPELATFSRLESTFGAAGTASLPLFARAVVPNTIEEW